MMMKVITRGGEGRGDKNKDRKLREARAEARKRGRPGGGCEVKSTLACQTTRVGAAMLFLPSTLLMKRQLLEPVTRGKQKKRRGC